MPSGVADHILYETRRYDPTARLSSSSNIRRRDNGCYSCSPPVGENLTVIDITVVDQDRRGACQHVVRVAGGPFRPAFSQVGGNLPVCGGAWKCVVVRACCRQRCCQWATPRRAVRCDRRRWSGFGRCPVRSGVGHDRGAVSCCDSVRASGPDRSVAEWPPVLLDAGPWPGRWVKPRSRRPQPPCCPVRAVAPGPGASPHARRRPPGVGQRRAQGARP